ncbi:MAG TPA: hypothetical protein VIG30_15260, partial [Ktedonobacterales bacterium]
VEVGAPDTVQGFQFTGALVTLNLLNTPGAAVGIDIWEYSFPIDKNNPYADDLKARDVSQQQQIVAALESGTTTNSPAFGPLSPNTNPNAVPVVDGVWTVIPLPNDPIH